MNTNSNIKAVLFTMDDALLKNDGIIMEEGIVEPNSDHLVTLVLHNNASHPVFLGEGQWLVVVQEMSEVVVDVAGVKSITG